MSTPSIKKNYIYNTLYQILIIIMPLITAPYTARVFEPDGVGIVSFTNSIMSYFTLFAALGTASYGQQVIAQNRDDKEKYSVLFWEIKIISSLSTLVCLAVWFVFIAMSDEYNIYYLVMTLNIVAVMFDISWFFGGHEQFKFIVLRNTVIKIVGVVCLFLFVKEKSHITLYLFVNGAITIIANLSMWSYLKKFLVKVDWRKLKVFRHLKEIMVYFIPTIATSIYTMLDKTMIGIITKDNYENGYYEQATKIVKMCLTLVTSLNTVMGARMAYLFVNKKTEEIKEKLDKSINFTMLIGIPLVLGLCGISSNFVVWFFGEDYKEVIPLMYIYSLIIIPIGLSNCLGGQLLTPSGQRARSNKGIIAGSVVNLILNCFMIPVYGAKGAALASVIAEMVIAIIYMYMAGEYMSWKQVFVNSYKRIIAGAIMLAAVLFIPELGGGIVLTIVQVAVGIVIYFGVLLILRDDLVRSGLNIVKAKLKKG